MKVRLKKQNRHEVESVNQTGIQAKSLTDIRPMDNALAAPQKPQTQEINHQQIQKKQGFNFAEIPISGNTDESAARIQPKFNLSLQKKLTVGAAGDKYEQEADSVAEKVVKQINTPSGEQSTSGQGVQRQEAEEEELQAKSDISNIQREGEEEEEIQAKSDISNIQREGEEEEEIQAKSDISNIQREGEEEEIQAKPDISNIQREGEEEEIQAKSDISAIQREGEEEEIQAKSDISAIQREGEEEEIQAKPQNKSLGGGAVSTDIETTIQSAKSGGSPLDAGLQQKMGKAMGADFSGVKVHTDSQADKLNRSLSSRAFATGPNLFFKRGEYNPGSRSGQELIAHELTHVVQQGASKIQSKRESVTHSTGSNSVMLQMKKYTVKDTAQARDESLKNKGAKYKSGQEIEISDDPKDHKIEATGNNKWYRIKDSNPPQYIRATRLQLYGTYIPEKSRVKESEVKTENDEKDETKKPSKEIVKDLLKVENRKFKDKHGDIKSEKMTLAKQIDLGKDFLPDEAVKAIEELSAIPKGKTFLSQNGMLTQEEVAEIAVDKKVFGDWERVEEHDFSNWTGGKRSGLVPDVRGEAVLSPIQRLQIATYQRDLGIKDEKFRQTPGYLRYEANQLKKGSDDKYKKNIYEKDTKMWEQTLDNQTNSKDESLEKYKEQTESANSILRRIFIILHDGLKYREDEKPNIFKDWDESVAVALSHGGRVMINLPPIKQNENENEFIQWLFGASPESDQTRKPQSYNKIKDPNNKSDHYKAKVDTRIASSHNVKVTESSLEEEKSNTFDVKGKTGLKSTIKHYGMDIPLGGLGNEDLAGDAILPDGRHGHIYIYYRPPSLTLPGSVLIGAETSRMAHTDVFGMYHDQRGAPAEFSSTGTSKGGRIGGEFGGRVVDYTKTGTKTEKHLIGKDTTKNVLEVKDPNWLQQLRQAEEKVQAGLITSKELVGKASKEVEQKLFGDRLSKRPEEQPVSTENANNSASSENEDENMNQETQNNVNTEQEENE
ncbi:conserved hypothetical protein [Planktothrix agardhii]|uniref:eCIS core domain-containing protein n=1 Tax=Planktothrix agardhii TaxID=1160 RepID=UPI001B9848C1|nr:DUF4157 domain-containing protein [Planktothrix agardhii]CAD0227822.1 conserved hypothetical protein [Planktothrix agardhii]